ncbi:hypothetical protein MUU72_26965 [Streptomyces sp. RS10V-4]|uniref:hypothetical protein n=1 Tax=Streptomyces rhizoryzae TaxID=2932493 RepID=UPI0020067B61|nr:hypothetical protein [Streptomyces rhizoryzae]MCK7626701.1 hypothetical protein [Streptomyces rhizoryzae]
MTPRTTLQDPQNAIGHPPGALVHDTVTGRVGRVADRSAYPPGRPHCDCVLLVPLAGTAPAWQAAPGALRRAADEEIEAAIAEAATR